MILFIPYQDRLKSCNLSTIGSTSFFPCKPPGCYGDGGGLFTNDNELAENFRWIRVQGQKLKHHHPNIQRKALKD
jgi:UDP-2-acetamido-2-deoxy-ribo-hexuluronate aminotransferase